MAANMYLKFENPSVKGASTAPGHEGEIEVLAWNAQPTGSRRSSGLSFSKYLDSATNELLKYCWSGHQFGKATLTCFRSDGAHDNKPVEYLTLVMEQVVISNYSVAGGPGDIPVENVSLEYSTVQYNYKEQKLTD
jgi:type VI secretion system secreted protein Hcp